MAAKTRKKESSPKVAKRARRGSNVARGSRDLSLQSEADALGIFKGAAGLILAVTENRNWIEVFFEGDMMHTKTVDLPAGRVFDIYIEEIPHKTTVYEHPRTMILFAAPCDLEITRDGDKVVVSGKQP